MDDDQTLNPSFINRFEIAWQSSPSPNIEDYLPSLGSDGYLGTLQELVIIDLEFCWKRQSSASSSLATSPSPVEAYVQRFPVLGDEPQLQKLVEEEFLIRHRYGDQPNPDEFVERFPQHGELLQKLANEIPTRPPVQFAVASSQVRPHPTIENYTLISAIGEGGMGSVYLAQQEHPVRRKVAVKVIRSGLDSREVIARFEAERQALAMMEHQNIARVFDAGATSQGQPFFAMEFVDGVPITDYCESRQASIPDRLSLFIDVCAAVQHAHQKGILHRDLKPSNVLIAEDEGRPVVKVIDFGLAKAVDSTELLTEKTIQTHVGQVLGTLKYMSPEQAATNEGDVDTRADVYALGIMLYELLTGETPLDESEIRNQGILTVLERIRDHEPVRPSVKFESNTSDSQVVSAGRSTTARALRQLLAGDLDWIVMKAIEKERDRRYESASGLADDVQRLLSHEPVSARPPSTSYRLQKFARKNRALVAFSSAMFLMLVAGIAATAWQAVRATNAEADAVRQKDIARGNAAKAESRRVEADELRGKEVTLRRDAESATQRAEDALNLLVNSFQTVDPRGGGLSNLLASDVIDLAWENLKSNAIKDPLTRAMVLRSLSPSYLGLGDVPKAVETAEASLQVCREHAAPGSKDVVQSVLRLATALLYQGDFESCENLLRDMLVEIHQRSVDERDQDQIAITQIQLGIVLTRIGKNVEAQYLIDSAIETMDNSPNKDEMSYTLALVALGEVHMGLGDHAQAVPILEKVIAFLRGKVGDFNPQTLRAMSSLAICQAEIGQLKQALQLHEEILVRARHAYPSTHRIPWIIGQSVAKTYLKANLKDDAIELLADLSNTHFAISNWAEATVTLEPLVELQMERAAKIHWQIAPPGTSNEEYEENEIEFGKLSSVWDNQLNLGVAYRNIGRFADSIEHLRNAVKGRSEYFGDTDINVQLSRKNLTGSLMAVSRPVEALEVMNEVIKFRNPDPKQFYNIRPYYQQRISLALWLHDAEQAREYLTEYQTVSPFDFQNTPGNTRAHMLNASVLCEAGDYKQAIAVASTAMNLYAVPEFEQARCRSMIAYCKAKENKSAETAPQAIEAFRVLESRQAEIYFQDLWFLVRSCEYVAEIFELGGDQKSVDEWKQHLQQLRESMVFRID